MQKTDPRVGFSYALLREREDLSERPDQGAEAAAAGAAGSVNLAPPALAM